MTAEARLERLRVEGRDRPLGVDEPAPRFSWTVVDGQHLVPRASRVTVRRAVDDALAWSSGGLPGTDLRAAPPDDTTWDSLTRYTWTIELDADVDGTPTTLTADSWFETGLLDDAAWEGSDWIGGAPADDTHPAPLLRLDAVIPDGVRSARLVLAAGGIAAFTINGAVPDDEVLSVGLTDFAERVPYVVHDVTSLVVAGPNALAVGLGRGFFGMTTVNTWDWHRAPWHGEPRVRALLIVEHDGGILRIGTGSAWRASRGGTLSDSYYEGEVFDARREPIGWRLPDFDDSSWKQAAAVAAPAGRVRARPFPGVRVVETISPVSVSTLENGRYVLDFGRQVAGWLRVHLPVTTAAGHEVHLRSTERLVAGVPNVSTNLSQGELQLDRLIASGGELEWEPSFGYKGFQYVDVVSWPDDDPAVGVVARVAHSDVERTGRFSSSDDRLTWMHEAAVTTMLNNLHHIPTDTPVFEKNGWTGDAALGAEMMLRDLGTVELLEDWVTSIAESRDRDGRPALIAPSPDWYWPEHMEAPPWHAAYWAIPWQLFQVTGDDRVLRRHAEGIFRYLRLEHGLLVDGLASTGLGDYLAPDKRGNPDEDMRACATISVHDGSLVGAAIAARLGDTATEREFRTRAAELRTAFRREFFDAEAGVVRDTIAGYRQTHNILALDSGMLDSEEASRVATALARDVDEHRNGHLWVGALGVRRALPVLSESGHADTAFRAATATDFPGWLGWRAAGATTMWEYWDDQRSRNHYFLATVDDWLFRNVVGLRPDEPGYSHVQIRPDHLDHVADARADLDTVRGELSVGWERNGADGVLRTRLPFGTTATVELPGTEPFTTSGQAEFRFQIPAEQR